MTHDHREYVILYQGASGGFIVSWIFQLAMYHNHLSSALNCFPLLLKDNPLIWKNYEIIPPNIGLLTTTFHKHDETLSLKEIEEQIHKTLKRLIKNDARITSWFDAKTRLKYFFCNYVWGCVLSIEHKLNPFDYSYYNGSVDHIVKLSDICYDSRRIIIVKSPTSFTKLCENNKGGTHNEKIDLCGTVSNNKVYIGPLVEQYEDQLMIFDTTSLWMGTWQDEVEKIINRKLTVNQSEACQQIIERWLYITPQIIKDEFNI